jgi:hypothetical protein
VKIIAILMMMLAAETPAPSTDFVLEPHRAGVVRVGENMDTLYSRLPLQDMELADLRAEGMFTPVMKIRVGGRPDAVHAFIGANGRHLVVRGIEVRDPRFRTAKGIHIGSTLGALRKAYGKVERVGGEGTVGARVESLSMIFNLGGDVYDNPRYRARDLSDVPADVPIFRIWVN